MRGFALWAVRRAAHTEGVSECREQYARAYGAQHAAPLQRCRLALRIDLEKNREKRKRAQARVPVLLVGFAEGLEIDAELLAFFVEVAAFEAEGAGDVGHVEIVALDFGEENFFFEGFGAFGEGAGGKRG